MTVDLAEPGYVPEGFRLLSRSYGAEVGGFADRAEQAVVAYAFGNDPHRLLSIFAAEGRGGGELMGTTGRPGVRLDAEIDGVQVLYHDGVWAMGPGPDQRQVGEGLTLHWETGDVHSLTLLTDGMAYAVRGQRSAGVSLNVLLDVARSLPLRWRVDR